MTDDDTRLLRRIADRQAIHDVIMRFARGIDRCDEELLRSCFHEDSYDDHGHFKGNGQDFAHFIVGSIAERAHHTTHSIQNVLIEPDPNDPDSASGESYVVAYLRRTGDDGKEWLDQFAGRYIDRFARRDAVWRIASRTVVHDWSVSTEIGDRGFPLPMEGFTQGRRDRGDPVYTAD